MPTERECRERLAEAHRILEREKLGDWIGHVTCRIPPGDRMLIKPQWVRLGTLRPRNFLVMDLEGKVLRKGSAASQKPLPPPSEWPLHAEIYRARKDVEAISHTHPLVATALSIAEVDIEPISHRSAYFADGVPVYPKPDLINRPELGVEVAWALGDKSALLLRGHGAVTVGSDIEEAVILSIFLEQSAQTQWIAATLGRPLRKLPKSFADPYVGLKPQRFPFVWEFFRSLHGGA